MTPIETKCEGYVSITHINGMSVPELINYLKNLEFAPVVQRTDACLDAEYILVPTDESDLANVEPTDDNSDLPAIEEVNEGFLEEEQEPEQEPVISCPFFNEDGSKADVPGEPGEPIMLAISFSPKETDSGDSDYYDVVDLMSDGAGNYHVYDTDNVGLLIDYDKIDYLISILEML